VPSAAGAGARPDQSFHTAEFAEQIRRKVFGGWPVESNPIRPVLRRQTNTGGLRCVSYELTTQPGIALDLTLIMNKRVGRPKKLVLTVLDSISWTNSPQNPAWPGWNPEPLAQLKQRMIADRAAFAFVAPRAVAPADWSNDPKKVTQIRRRFMLLGQTLDGMRVWDIRCAVHALESLPELKSATLTLRAQGEMGVNAAYAALFEPSVAHLELSRIPSSHRQGPDYLNVLKMWDTPQLLDLLAGRAVCSN
ncbi:MAG TPA: hypothetical protein VHI52_11195, partial [Verrucomicrobiae bacterium]|nr:hypothetical protein [Verrucomicrobiae bacterium]